MSSTPEEFRRALSQAFGAAVTGDANGLLLAEGGVSLHFSLQTEKTRQIGALQLACLRVEISIQAGDAVAAKNLLARVDRATLRGGG